MQRAWPPHVRVASHQDLDNAPQRVDALLGLSFIKISEETQEETEDDLEDSFRNVLNILNEWYTNNGNENIEIERVEIGGHDAFMVEGFEFDDTISTIVYIYQEVEAPQVDDYFVYQFGSFKYIAKEDAYNEDLGEDIVTSIELEDIDELDIEPPEFELM